MNEESLNKVKRAAVGLIISGSLNGALALLALLSGVMRLAGVMGRETLPANSAERTGFLIATVGSYGIALVTLALAPVVIYGAVQMMNGRKYGLAKTAAILSIVPVTSCCFLIGVPIGIWGLVVLGKPEVKALFRGESHGGGFYPPQPPRSW